MLCFLIGSPRQEAPELMKKTRLLPLVLVLFVGPVLEANAVWKPSSPTIAILLLEFPDLHHSRSSSDIDKIMTVFQSYWKEVSYGQFVPTWRTFDWRMATLSHSYFAVIDPRSVIYEGLTVFDPTVDFSQFNGVIVVHAGGDQYYTHNSTDLRSASWVGPIYPQKDLNLTLDGVKQIGLSTVSEFDHLDSYVHEYERQLNISPSGTPDIDAPLHVATPDKIAMGWISLTDTTNISATRPGLYILPLRPAEEASGLRYVGILNVPLMEFGPCRVRLACLSMTLDRHQRIGFDRTLDWEGIYISGGIVVGVNLTTLDPPYRDLYRNCTPQRHGVTRDVPVLFQLGYLPPTNLGRPSSAQFCMNRAEQPPSSLWTANISIGISFVGDQVALNIAKGDLYLVSIKTTGMISLDGSLQLRDGDKIFLAGTHRFSTLNQSNMLVKWNDGLTGQIRTFNITRDIAIQANFTSTQIVTTTTQSGQTSSSAQSRQVPFPPLAIAIGIALGLLFRARNKICRRWIRANESRTAFP